METRFFIEIETPDANDLDIVPEEGKSEEDFTPKELKACREEHANGLHKEVIKKLKDYFDEEGKDDTFEDNLINDLEELSIEGCESFEDYGIKIKVGKLLDPSNKIID